MAKRRKPEAPVTQPKPNVSVSSATSRSKPTSNNQLTKSDIRLSRNNLVSITPTPKRSIPQVQPPSNSSRSKRSSIESTTTNTHSIFPSRKELRGGDKKERPLVDPTSGSTPRSRPITSLIQGGKDKPLSPRRSVIGTSQQLSSIGGGPIPRGSQSQPLRVSDL